VFVRGHGVGRWLGRWLCCWLGLLAAGGCGTHSALPVATLVPLATMPDYNRIPPTRAPVWRLRLTPTRSALLTVSASPPRATLIGAANIAAALKLEAPTCYETPVGSLWCLGLIHNPLTVMVMSLRIRVSLVTVDGLAVLSQETTSSRQWLSSGATAPYGVLFTEPPVAAVTGPVAETIQAEAVKPGLASAVPLPTRDLHGELVDNHYHIQAVIDNPTAYTVRLAIVITLLDAAGRVTGYRQIEWPTRFLPGASLPIDVDGIALAAGATHFTIAADGLPLESS